jgi:small subunit ribosomal protein S6
MQHYELFFIGSMALSSEEQKSLLEKVASHITSLGVATTLTKEVGKRRLAYPIKKETQGNYFLIEFDGEQSLIAKLDRELKLMPAILRHILLKKHVKTAEEIDREEKIRAKIEGKKRDEEQAELAKEKEKIEEIKSEEKKPESSKKISLEDLDKKLDDILKEDI